MVPFFMMVLWVYFAPSEPTPFAEAVSDFNVTDAFSNTILVILIAEIFYFEPQKLFLHSPFQNMLISKTDACLEKELFEFFWKVFHVLQF